MWLILAFLSAALLGCYDSCKKKSLRGNAVIPVLFLNTVFCSLLFLPLMWLSASTHLLDSTALYVPQAGWEVHRYILLKSVIVLSSWMFGYFAMAHLPLTIVGPVNATRPVMTLVGAMLVFGERLNAWQWAGVTLAIVSLYMLSRSGRREGIDFRHNRWVLMLLAAALLGAASGLYDKYLMAPAAAGGLGLDRMTVQSWYLVYQMVMMGVVTLIVWWPAHRRGARMRWEWSILCISLFLTVADYLYFYALSLPGAMISVVSMVRRGSVIVSFLFGAMFFREQNLRAKAIDLALVLLGMVCLWIGG